MTAIYFGSKMRGDLKQRFGLVVYGAFAKRLYFLSCFFSLFLYEMNLLLHCH